jgi:alpha-L-fucosidase
MEIYDNSVGRGANMLLNIGPAATGRLPEKDKARLMEFAAALKSRFEHPVSDTVHPEGDSILFDHPREINLVVLYEDLTEGESIQEFELLCDGNSVYKGGTVGHKCICSFDKVSAKEVSVKVTKSHGEHKLSRLAAYCCEN